MNTTYFPVKGARITVEQAQRYGSRIEKIKQANGGSGLVMALIEDAKYENSPLHDYFEWDDRIAAAEHRLSQAYHLIAWIGVKVEDAKNGGEPTIIRKFYFTESNESEHRDVSSLEEVVADSSKLSQVCGFVRSRVIEDSKRLRILEALAQGSSKKLLSSAVKGLGIASKNLELLAV